ncbi:MAG: hypothetical protein K0S07_1778 [Chlamydiales bacterium]|jgi:hypothetical protein|nr:hypothetical protein [Chlamydiales bacterium]
MDANVSPLYQNPTDLTALLPVEILEYCLKLSDTQSLINSSRVSHSLNSSALYVLSNRIGSATKEIWQGLKGLGYTLDEEALSFAYQALLCAQNLGSIKSHFLRIRKKFLDVFANLSLEQMAAPAALIDGAKNPFFAAEEIQLLAIQRELEVIKNAISMPVIAMKARLGSLIEATQKLQTNKAIEKFATAYLAQDQLGARWNGLNAGMFGALFYYEKQQLQGAIGNKLIQCKSYDLASQMAEQFTGLKKDMFLKKLIRALVSDAWIDEAIWLAHEVSPFSQNLCFYTICLKVIEMEDCLKATEILELMDEGNLKAAALEAIKRAVR